MATPNSGSGLTPVTARLVRLPSGRSYLIGAIPLTIGREPSSAVPVHREEVSRSHAHILRTPEGFLLVDSSLHGTYVNAKRVQARQMLADGDVVQIGGQSFRFDLPSTDVAGRLNTADAPETNQDPRGPLGVRGTGKHALALALMSLACATAWLSLPLAAQVSQLDSISRYVEGEMKRQQIPGLSVAIVRGDSILLARGFGFANLEHRVPATDSTVYQSGSLGKQFTATAVGMLAGQGRLGVNDRIIKWFTEGKGVWDSVTVRQLLTHTSGIPNYTDSLIDLRKDYTEEQLVRLAASQRLDFPAGASWSYSNTGYLLLGVLIHRVTGRFYGDILHDLLFAPLNMQTRIISEADVVPNRAAGYRLVGSQLKNQEWVSPTLNTTADGALYLTVNDLARWALALREQSLPPAAVLDEAWTPVRLKDGGAFPYGYGWGLTEQRGHRRIGHTGSWQGFKTAIYRYPEFDLAVVALANLAEANPGPIAEGVAGIVEPKLQPPQLLRQPLRGPNPPVPIATLLRQIVTGNETGLTPGARRHLAAAARRQLPEVLGQVGSWTALGCEHPGGGTARWLGANPVRKCYARAAGAAKRAVAVVYYTGGWEAAYFEVDSY